MISYRKMGAGGGDVRWALSGRNCVGGRGLLNERRDGFWLWF